MNQQQLQQEVISCLWSRDLKKYIAEHHTVFDNRSLVFIAYQFAPSYEERLRLLQLLADHAPDVSAFADQCIRFQRECWDQFCRHGENEVYELCIKDNPDAYEERYLCADWHTALELIDGFYREYDFAPEQATVRYRIVKRKILLPSDDFQEDEIQECVLGAGKVLISAEIWRNEGDPKHEIENVVFPGFVPNLSAVRYKTDDNTIAHGVCLGGEDFPSEACYVIPLDHELLKTGQYDQHPGYHWHEHIPGPNVEILPPEELSQEEQSIYQAFVRYWKQQEENAQP